MCFPIPLCIIFIHSSSVLTSSYVVCTCPHVWFLWSLKVLYRLCIAVIYIYQLQYSDRIDHCSCAMHENPYHGCWKKEWGLSILQARPQRLHIPFVVILWSYPTCRALPLGDLTMNSAKFQLNRLKKTFSLERVEMAEVDHENGHFLRFSLVFSTFFKTSTQNHGTSKASDKKPSKVGLLRLEGCGYPLRLRVK